MKIFKKTKSADSPSSPFGSLSPLSLRNLTNSGKIMKEVYPSQSTFPVVKLTMTATDLPNLEAVGTSDPYFKLYGYTAMNEEDGSQGLEHLYTSEVVSSCVDFVRWKPGYFGVPNSIMFEKFRIYIYDKEMFGRDRLIVGPVDIQPMQSTTYLGVDNAYVRVNKFEKM